MADAGNQLSLLERVAAWNAAEPDADLRAELDELLTAARGGTASSSSSGAPASHASTPAAAAPGAFPGASPSLDPTQSDAGTADDVAKAALTELSERFNGRLQFGTAGLRAAVGAGPMRMNRLVVRQAAAGLGRWLLDNVDDAADRGVAIAHDARRKSDVFALDTCRVLAAMGIRSMLLPGVQPTPVLAWSITGLGAAAGVVVTASHNPPADNGYKVYLSTGSQIVAPIDAEIAERIDRFDPLDVELTAADHPLIERLGDEWTDAYVAAAPSVRLRPDVPGVPVAYTAMHGVGGAIVERAFAASGLPAPHVVAEQHAPDGTFPTVSFPNPEEPGAMGLVIELAERVGASAAFANDPDADRLGVAIPQPDGSWRRLTGDEIGWLFADHILTNTSPTAADTSTVDGDASGEDDRLVVTTLVSSSLLSVMAKAHGVESVETFTGFKWVAKEALDRPHKRLVFGYEQALGYLVTDRPLDKDGITAAVLMAEIAACAVADGATLQDRLDTIAERFGQYVISDLSVPMKPADGAAWVDSLRRDPPATVGGRAVTEVTEYPEAGLLRLMLDGDVRLQLRPSGTEPKVKLYGEAVDLPRDQLDALLAALAALR